jgi:hypothetical protein
MLPFMNMDANAVYLIVQALTNNIFRGMVILFKEKIPQLKLTARLKQFQRVFIMVVCSYINKEFIFYTDMPYEKIM